MTSSSTGALPAKGTLFDTFTRSYADVPIDHEKNNTISTTEFLEATESMTALFGNLYADISLVIWLNYPRVIPFTI